MYDYDRILDSLAVRRKGAVVRREAIAAGVPHWVMDDRVRAGVLIVLYDGVYRHAAVPFTHDLRLLAAVLACGPDAVLFGRSAAALLGWPGARKKRPEVLSPHTDLPRIKGVDLHRGVRIRPFERTVVRGIPCTAPGKTALDYCALTSFEHAQEVISSAVVTKLLEPETIISAIERSGGQGQRGTVKLRGVAQTLDEIKELESVLELHGWRELERCRLPRSIPQYELVCDDGRKVRFDRAWPEVKLGLDFDGKRWHATPARKRRTRERHESIISSGWGHLTYGWSDVHETPDEMRAETEDTYWKLEKGIWRPNAA